MRVSAADDQREHRKLQLAVAVLPLFQQHGVNVSFEMIDGDERLVERISERLGVAQADQQRAGQSGALGDGDGIDGRRNVLPASSRALRTTGTMARRCSREASSGTTPP